MKTILKKLTAILTSVAIMFGIVPVAFAGIEVSVEDAYYKCADVYPEFVDAVKARGVTDEQIIVFLETMQDELLALDVEITEDNFEDYFIYAVEEASSWIKNIPVRDALLNAFPGAALDAAEGIISPEFEPILETIRIILFGGEEEETETEETEPTEEETQPTEKETVAPTEKETEEVTEKETEPSTDEEVVVPTEDKTEKETEKQPEKEPVGGGVIEEDIPLEQETEPTVKPTEPTVKFTDMVQASWAENSVNAMVNMGVISGYPDGTFKPNNPITRAEFAKIIVLTSGRFDAKEKYTCTFSDVGINEWYYPYVSAAFKFGFIAGRSETIFDPNSQITRADLCLIVYRYIKTINSEFKAKGTVTFADGNLIPSYAQEAVNALCSNGVATGVDAVNNKFDPLAPATRAQCAVIVHNAMNAALGLK